MKHCSKTRQEMWWSWRRNVREIWIPWDKCTKRDRKPKICHLGLVIPYTRSLLLRNYPMCPSDLAHFCQIIFFLLNMNSATLYSIFWDFGITSKLCTMSSLEFLHHPWVLNLRYYVIVHTILVGFYQYSQSRVIRPF